MTVKKALVVYGSPHGENGQTARLMEPFIGGMAAAGAAVEKLFAYRLKVGPCLGCFACWVRTPGRCVQEDEMAEALPKFREADVVVLGTPVYVDGMPGPLKTMVDRLLPLVQPFVEIREGRVRHPRGEGARPAALALLSTCGFAEPANFDPLIQHVRALCANLSWRYAGALTVPGSVRPERYPEIGAAAFRAGRLTVETGEIPQGLQAVMHQDLTPTGEFVERFNAWFRRVD